MPELVPLNEKFNRPISSGAIIPRDLNEAYRLAQVIHMAALQPKDLDTPEKIMVAIMHGLEIGLKPMQAMQRIAVINNRPTIWGDAALGLVRASGLLVGFEEFMQGSSDELESVCRVKRRGDESWVERTFSVQDAKVAGLWMKKGYNGKDTPWITHPKRMLQMRARGFCLRDAFPDVLGGMYLREEIEGEAIDITPAIPTPPTPPPLPPKDPEIPADALTDFDAFHKALDSAPTKEALDAMFKTLTSAMNSPDDLAEAADRYHEVISKFAT